MTKRKYKNPGLENKTLVGLKTTHRALADVVEVIELLVVEIENELDRRKELEHDHQ